MYILFLLFVGEHACTCIPNHDAPGGKVSVALNKMRKVAEEFQRDTERKNAWGAWWDWFSPYASFLLPAAIFVAAMCLFGPYICARIRRNSSTVHYSGTTALFSTPGIPNSMHHPEQRGYELHPGAIDVHIHNHTDHHGLYQDQ